MRGNSVVMETPWVIASISRSSSRAISTARRVSFAI
jgi:hypothetical protein